MLRNSQVAAQLVASRAVLSFTELVNIMARISHMHILNANAVTRWNTYITIRPPASGFNPLILYNKG
jgi:hypothetical protein